MPNAAGTAEFSCLSAKRQLEPLVD